MFTYAGNIHIHSRYSDGRGTIGEIAAAASAAGLNYIIITDHETLAGLPEEEIYDGVVLLVGTEINRLHNHYLALDLEKLVKPDEENPQRVINRVREAGGLGFIAHPFEKGSLYIEKGKAYPWKQWPVFGFHGIEIWNYASHWRGRHPSLYNSLYHFLLNRKAALYGPPVEVLRLWDCYTRAGHRVVAIGGSDAHAMLYRFGLLRATLFTYRYIFTTINTYILLQEELSREFAVAKKQILSALRDGRCYISFDSLHRGKDFYFYAAADEVNVPMGGEIEYRDGIILHIKAPGRRPLIRLINNGKLIREEEGRQLDYRPAKPGVYRVEVYYRSFFGQPRPWIYSNPIYVHPATSSLQELNK